MLPVLCCSQVDPATSSGITQKLDQAPIDVSIQHQQRETCSSGLHFPVVSLHLERKAKLWQGDSLQRRHRWAASGREYGSTKTSSRQAALMIHCVTPLNFEFGTCRKKFSGSKTPIPLWFETQQWLEHEASLDLISSVKLFVSNQVKTYESKLAEYGIPPEERLVRLQGLAPFGVHTPCFRSLALSQLLGESQSPSVQIPREPCGVQLMAPLTKCSPGFSICVSNVNFYEAQSHGRRNYLEDSRRLLSNRLL